VTPMSETPETTPEEIAAREARPRTPDDPADICERLAPGHHEQRVRAKVAEEIRQYAGENGERYSGAIWEALRLSALIAETGRPATKAALDLARGEQP
jgi:hypothetical protein